MTDIPEDIEKLAMATAGLVLTSAVGLPSAGMVRLNHKAAASAIARALMVVQERAERAERALDGILAANGRFLAQSPNADDELDPVTQACRRARRILAGDEA